MTTDRPFDPVGQDGPIFQAWITVSGQGPNVYPGARADPPGWRALTPWIPVDLVEVVGHQDPQFAVLWRRKIGRVQ